MNILTLNNESNIKANMTINTKKERGFKLYTKKERLFSLKDLLYPTWML